MVDIGQERLSGIFEGIPAIYLLLFCEAIEQLGFDADQITHGLGVTRSDLLSPQGRITLKMGYIAAQRGAALASERGLGIIYGQKLTLTLHGSLGMLAMTSSSVADALDAMTRYLAIRAPFFSCQINEQGELATFELNPMLVMDAPISSFMSESVLIAVALIVQKLVPGAKLRVCFSAPKPKYAKRLTQNLDVELCYGSPCNQLVIPREVFASAPSMSDPVAAKLAKEQCELEYQRLFAADETLSDQIARHLKHCPTGKMLPSVTQIASRFHLSERTLRRKLDELNSSYRALLERELEERAKSLLRQSGMSVTAVSMELGYSSSGNFSAAFKRMTGMTPKAYQNSAHSS